MNLIFVTSQGCFEKQLGVLCKTKLSLATHPKHRINIFFTYLERIWTYTQCLDIFNQNIQLFKYKRGRFNYHLGLSWVLNTADMLGQVTQEYVYKDFCSH